MMGYGYNWGMMGGSSGWMFLAWLVLFIDLVLVGIWLWKQINK